MTMSTITTPNNPLSLLLPSNATDSSWPTRNSQTSKPSDDGIIQPDGMNQLIVMPFGKDTADQLFDMRLIGWSHAETAAAKEWVPAEIVTVRCTLGTATGASGGVIGSDQHWCDTITYQSGASGVTIISPGNNERAYLVADFWGFELLEILFNRDTAASANALYRRI